MNQLLQSIFSIKYRNAELIMINYKRFITENELYKKATGEKGKEENEIMMLLYEKYKKDNNISMICAVSNFFNLAMNLYGEYMHIVMNFYEKNKDNKEIMEKVKQQIAPLSSDVEEKAAKVSEYILEANKQLQSGLIESSFNKEFEEEINKFINSVNKFENSTINIIEELNKDIAH